MFYSGDTEVQFESIPNDDIDKLDMELKVRYSLKTFLFSIFIISERNVNYELIINLRLIYY